MVQNGAMLKNMLNPTPARIAGGLMSVLLTSSGSEAQPAAAAPKTAVSAQMLGAVDRIFERWQSSKLPGCTVGVASEGRSVLTRAYGMADLEHGIANQPDSIIEAGSVSKQITAAAVLLLAQQGKVDLDDPARKHIPELPDYGPPLTVRHMLTHTSGLRDWGSVQSIAGWPRTTRAYTHAHVLDTVSRQRSLNFVPGTAYSYSNTGYNLAAILVSRVSGQSFAEFTRVRIFEPLGMTRTSWRDDFTRVVPGRSIAYSVADTGVTMDMPFENVHGNGALLTTVADLLRWNENATSLKVGGKALVDQQQETARLNSGEKIDYAYGLRVGSWRGIPEVSHGGATAGYRAWLARYPTRKQVSVAVLCNAANAPAPALGRQVADLFLAVVAGAPASSAPVKLDSGTLQEIAGLYRERRRNHVVTIELQGQELRMGGQEALIPVSRNEFRLGASTRIEVDRNPAGAVQGLRLLEGGEGIGFERVEPVRPTAAALEAYAGEYKSDEAEVTVRLAVEDGQLVVHQRPDRKVKLTPTFTDGFQGAIGGVRFFRGPGGVVSEMSLSQDRVWDLRFERLPDLIRR